MDKVKWDVSGYEFTQFSESKEDGGLKEYKLKELNLETPEAVEEHSKTIKIERTFAENSRFDVSPIVKEHRGLIKQEISEKEQSINEEVEKRLAKIKEDAYAEGYQTGVEQGKTEVFEQTRVETEQKLAILTELISEVLETKAELLNEAKLNIYKTIRSLTKWIILRELKDDGKYIHRLLEKLIIEIQTKSGLLVQVDQKSFDNMPEVLEFVQNKLGKLENVRVEMDYDVDGPGIILESGNGIINGTLGEQLKSLDKLFESVGLVGTEKLVVEQEFSKDESTKDQDDDSKD